METDKLQLSAPARRRRQELIISRASSAATEPAPFIKF